MATEKQSRKLAGIIVEHSSDFISLSNESAQWAIQHPRAVMSLICSALDKNISPFVSTERANQDEIIDTNLSEAVKVAEAFAKKHFGLTVDLAKQFILPTELPWKDVLVVYDPGTLSNSDAIELLNKLGFNPWQETDVNRYSGFKQSGVPTLHIIRNGVRPDDDTMNLSPNDLWKTGKSYLTLRGYALAFALRHEVCGDYLDPETFTWFPENRLSSGGVTSGDWNGAGRRVGFSWSHADYRNSNGGARAAMSCVLRT